VNLIDTSAWIEYFFGGPNATYFSTAIEDTEHLLVPVLCLYEVFKKVSLVADEARAFRAVAQMKQGRVVLLNEEIALRAATISLEHKLPMADSFSYATARSEDAVVWTQDSDFEGLADVNYMEARTCSCS